MGLRRFVFLTLSLFSLWVLSSCDSTSPPEPPVAEAGPDQPNANVGELVTLNGSGSYDTKNKTLTFSWTFLSQPAGSTATLSGATTSVASFTPDVGGTYVVQLTVNNGKLTAADQCTITVNGRPFTVEVSGDGAVLVAGAKAPKLVTREMLGTMQKGAVLVDVAIDQGGCFETSKPTTHTAPTYTIDEVVHYCVANMPGAVAKTSTLALTAC